MGFISLGLAWVHADFWCWEGWMLMSRPTKDLDCELDRCLRLAALGDFIEGC